MLLIVAQAAAAAPMTADTGPREPWRPGSRTGLWFLCADWRAKERECTSYIDGGAQALSEQARRRGEPPLFCPPRPTAHSQKRSAIVRYMERHPELDRASGVETVAAALAAAFRRPPPAPAR
ncbi:MAG TPA: Rap1a/Tai family immunity protein [Allosphingosinicella sp.]|nr:Rap1a/Tai family immunity protein [Allosphingosinicella sp.]